MPRRRRDSDHAVRRKLVIVGDGAAGKTSLLFRFKTDTFAGIYVPTVFETYVQDIYAGDQKVELELWDTAGQEDYDRLRPLSYPDTDILMLIYSIVDPDSLDNIITKWSPEVSHYCPSVPVLLIGCKGDLRSDPATLQELHTRKLAPVQFDYAAMVAERIGAVDLFETSSFTREGVQEAFQAATQIALRPKRKRRAFTCTLF